MVLPQVIKDLLENGVHFGHLSKHWNPRMEKFIFGKKKNIYIINLEKTYHQLQEAKDFIRKIAQNGEKILFVGTKKQIRPHIREIASSCNMPYVIERWVGGLLTNFSTVSEQIRKYKELLERRQNGEFEKMPRKEVVRLNRQLERMEKNYQGLVDMDKLPACVYVIDPKREHTCIREAQRLQIPIVALVDTDANPEVIDYPIPGNDDAIKSVRYITQHIADAIFEASRSKEEKKESEDKSESSEQEPANSREETEGDTNSLEEKEAE